MSAHMCTTLTDGCYRCDLNRDEIAAMAAEDREDAAKAWFKYRDSRPRALVDGDARKAVLRSLRKREFIAGFIAGRQS